MFELFKDHHPRRHVKSFKYAFEGLYHALLNEPNFRIQLLIAAVSVALGIHYQITSTEWSILIITLGMLLGAEMTNTVVEELIDHFIKEYHEGAKIIKDLSAGFVLIAGFTALAILLLIFASRISASL